MKVTIAVAVIYLFAAATASPTKRGFSDLFSGGVSEVVSDLFSGGGVSEYVSDTIEAEVERTAISVVRNFNTDFLKRGLYEACRVAVERAINEYMVAGTDIQKATKRHVVEGIKDFVGRFYAAPIQEAVGIVFPVGLHAASRVASRKDSRKAIVKDVAKEVEDAVEDAIEDTLEPMISLSIRENIRKAEFNNYIVKYINIPSVKKAAEDAAEEVIEKMVEKAVKRFKETQSY